MTIMLTALFAVALLGMVYVIESRPLHDTKTSVKQQSLLILLAAILLMASVVFLSLAVISSS